MACEGVASIRPRRGVPLKWLMLVEITEIRKIQPQQPDHLAWRAAGNKGHLFHHRPAQHSNPFFKLTDTLWACCSPQPV
jgi:hypothetical protein